MAITNRDRDHWIGWIRRKIRAKAALLKQGHTEEIDAVKADARIGVMATKLGADLLYVRANAAERERLRTLVDELNEKRSDLEREARERLETDRYTYDFVECVESRIDKATDKTAKEILMQRPWAIEAQAVLDSEQSYIDALMFVTSNNELRNIIKAMITQFGDDKLLALSEEIS